MRRLEIISASRRTDIPRYYARWFAERRREGVAGYRTAYGTSGEVSLRNEDVLAYLFWTRDGRPFAGELRTLREEGVPYAVQYTITGLGTAVEPTAPNRTHVIEDFRTVSRDLPDPGCIQWRYDPIVLSERYTPAFHRENFTVLARALAGATRVVNTSIVEPYLRAVRRMDPSVCYRAVDPDRHKTVAKRYSGLPRGREDVVGSLLRELAEIAHPFGMELRACSNPEWILPASQCVGPGRSAAMASATVP